MVFTKREIPSPKYLVPYEVDNIDNKHILQVSNQIRMAGMISQFTKMMLYSNELFTNLLNEANSTYDRIKNLGTRVDVIQAKLPSIESKFESPSTEKLKIFNQTPGTLFVAENPEKHQHFVADTKPIQVTSVRESCVPPPRLDLLDVYADEETKPCLTKYTHPGFFLEQWAAEQEKKMIELKAERKKKREERVARRAAQEKATPSLKPVQKLKKTRFDSQTGLRIVEDEDITRNHSISVSAGQNETSDTSTPRSLYNSSPGVSEPKPPPKPKKNKNKNKPVTVDVPALPNTNAPEVPTLVPEFPSSNAPLPPTNFSQSANTKSNNFNIPAFDSSIPAPPPPVDNYIPPPSVNSYIPPPIINNSIPAPLVNNSIPPPPPPINTADSEVFKTAAPPPPPPPPPTSNNTNQQSNDILSQIRTGPNLRTVDATPIEKPTDTRTSLLENIRAGLKDKLKSADQRKLAEKPKNNMPSSVAEILARRVAIEPDSDDDENDDNDDWSD